VVEHDGAVDVLSGHG